jgi:hypothetical protein
LTRKEVLEKKSAKAYYCLKNNRVMTISLLKYNLCISSLLAWKGRDIAIQDGKYNFNRLGMLF